MLQVGVVFAFLVASALYAAPSLVAVVKGRKAWLLVVLLNILLGWTILGWLLALAIALDARPRRPAWAKLRLGRRVRPVPRSPEADAAAKPREVREVMDPPEIREDVYATWLDQGAAMPSQAGKAG